MSILSHHAIRARLRLDQLDEYANEDVAFVSDEEVEAALTAGEFSIRESESVIAELKAVSSRLIAERGATINDVDTIERVAGESLVSKGVRSVLTSQPTELYYHEVRVATEALGDKLKVGIIIAIITIIIKIIGWIMGSSKEAKMTDWAAEVKKIPERIETSEGTQDGVNQLITSDIWRNAFERERKRLASKSDRSKTYASLIMNCSVFEGACFKYNLLQKDGKPGLMDALLKDRGIDLATVMLEELEAVRGTESTPREDVFIRCAIVACIKTNLFATCFDSKSENIDEAFRLWYGNEVGKLDSIFGYTGWRLFTDQAFDYFRSPDHGQHLKKLEYQLIATQKALNSFEADFARKKDFPFDAKIGKIGDRWLDGSTPFNQKGPIPTLEEAPLLWAPAYVTHALGSGAYGSLNGNYTGDDRIWFNEFVSSAVFVPGALTADRIGHTFVLSTVNTGGGNRTRVSYTNDNTLKNVNDVVSNTHSVTNIEMRLVIGDMNVIDANNAMDGFNARGYARDTNEYIKPAIYIPTVNCIPRKSSDINVIYTMSMKMTHESVELLSLIGSSRAKDIAKAASLEVNKYDGIYKHLEKAATGILKQMKSIEGKAKRNIQTLNATYKSHYTADTVRSVDALLVLWWQADNGKAANLEKIKSGRGGPLFPKEKLDDIADNYRVENPWFALKDMLETAKVISRISGHAQKVAAELSKSPLVGLEW